MSTRNFYANAAGRAAVWTGDDDLPFTDPLNHLDRVKFHTDLDYIRVIEERSLTLSLPLRSNFQSAVASYPLFSHGRAGFPFILGKVNVNGIPVAFTGTVPVQMGVSVGGSVAPRHFGRWLSLGADATDVIVHEYAVAEWATSSVYTQYDAIDLDITVYVTDEILE